MSPSSWQTPPTDASRSCPMAVYDGLFHVLLKFFQPAFIAQAR